MYKIFVSEAAKTDLSEIFDYIASDNVEQAEKFIDKMEAEINGLSIFPYKCREYDGSNKSFANCRVLIFYPYKVFYKIINDDIYIVQIKHGARKD